MDIIRDAECITSQSTQSREPQKVSKTVGFESEEISKLKKDIEAIDSLIEDKKSIIKANEDKWYYKHSQKLLAVLTVTGLTTVLFPTIAFLLNAVNGFKITEGIILLYFCGLGIFGVSTIFSIKEAPIQDENSNLSDTINYLEEIKKQKLSELGQKQRDYSKVQPTQSPRKKINQLEFYKEALKILQNMQKEPSKETIEQVKVILEQIEEKGKQKTLGTK